MSTVPTEVTDALGDGRTVPEPRLAVKTISNYANQLFHTELDKAFAGRVWEE